MQTSTEKLTDLREVLTDHLEAFLTGSGQTSGMASMAVAFLRPQVEALVDDFLTRDRHDIDAGIVQLVDFLARQLSDDVDDVLAGPGGVTFLPGPNPGAPVDLEAEPGPDPLRAPDSPGGSDEVGQVASGPQAVPVGGGASSGDRPG